MNGEGARLPQIGPPAAVFSLSLFLFTSSCLLSTRWMHAGCESLFTEDDVEQAADEGFDCVSCQPYVVKPAGESRVLGGGEEGSAQGCFALGQGLQLFVLSTAPVAPPELVPMKVKEPGESQ